MTSELNCNICWDSGVELIPGGHGTVIEEACSMCQDKVDTTPNLESITAKVAEFWDNLDAPVEGIDTTLTDLNGELWPETSKMMAAQMHTHVHDEVVLNPVPSRTMEMLNLIMTEWHVRHEDEVYAGDLCIANCCEPEIAQNIVETHNAMFRMGRTSALNLYN